MGACGWLRDGHEKRGWFKNTTERARVRWSFENIFIRKSPSFFLKPPHSQLEKEMDLGGVCRGLLSQYAQHDRVFFYYSSWKSWKTTVSGISINLQRGATQHYSRVECLRIAERGGGKVSLSASHPKDSKPASYGTALDTITLKKESSWPNH